jgi:hypothetical protein
MKTDALPPKTPQVSTVNGRACLPVPWDEADSLRELLRKSGCPTTLCLNPETHEARLELWAGVTPEAVLGVLESRRTGRPPVTSSAVTPDRPREAAPVPAAAPTADMICI